MALTDDRDWLGGWMVDTSIPARNTVANERLCRGENCGDMVPVILTWNEKGTG